jgi:SM-20-related protein
LEQLFEALITDFIRDKVGIAEHFLSPELAFHLKENLITAFAENKFHEAGTGNSAAVHQDQNNRSDSIYWLDRSHNNTFEHEFFKLMDAFVLFLNATCYTGITDYEFHYTLYEKGSFYKKHFDQFRNNDCRQYSMIMYLNTNWQKTDGGELCIYQEKDQQRISPENGKLVFFKSNELLHEVLKTNVPRMSITGWLKTG